MLYFVETFDINVLCEKS